MQWAVTQQSKRTSCWVRGNAEGLPNARRVKARVAGDWNQCEIIQSCPCSNSIFLLLSTHRKHTCKLCSEPSHSSQRELDAKREERLLTYQLLLVWRQTSRIFLSRQSHYKEKWSARAMVVRASIWRWVIKRLVANINPCLPYYYIIVLC